MAVIKEKDARKKTKEKAPLQALTAAALLLPGIMPNAAKAIEDSEFTFQYGHYQERERKVSSIDRVTDSLAPKKVNVPQNLNPIEADSLQTSIKVALTDRIKFNANFSQDTWSGATPISSAPAIFGNNNTVAFTTNGVVTGASPNAATVPGLFDTKLNPLGSDLKPIFGGAPFGTTFIDTEVAHTMTAASAETRKQGDFSISYDWDEAAVNLGGGISIEPDFESRFFNLGGQLDFNRKLTTVDFGVNYTNSAIHALSDHHAQGYFSVPTPDSALASKMRISVSEVDNHARGKTTLIEGRRQDVGFNLGLTQIINKNAFFKISGAYTNSEGYLGNPYKGVNVYILDSNSAATIAARALYGPDVLAVNSTPNLLERRPVERNQWHWNARLVQHIEALDASIHLGYQFSHDDWGVNTHTFDADWVQPVGGGWSITPRIRYYSQSEADFFTPYLVRVNTLTLPDHFSSDHRLSGFGTLSGGLTIKKEFAKGVSLEGGVEYYTHQGALKLGGNGEGSYADFDFYAFNAALNINMSALGRGINYAGSHEHGVHRAPLPAGISFGHMLKKRNQFMVGYRYQYSQASGDLLHGTKKVTDQQVVANGCEDDLCLVAPRNMEMHMHMVDLMYAPTDWLTLMLMPQFVDKNMTMNELSGHPPAGSNTFSALGGAFEHTAHKHFTGGLGDTGIYAMFKIFDNFVHHLHLTLGATAPTGDAEITLRGAHGFDDGFIHYGMQVGSGTWDFKPSLTYTGQLDKFSWGAQVNATKRLGKNNAGFTFGNDLQATAWGGYRLTSWLNASVRGIYSTVGDLKGEYVVRNADQKSNPVANVPVGTMDYTSNYGGQYWDVGFGINAMIPTGNFAGNTFSFEWQQPVVDDVNGYQRERDGKLTASWSYMF